MLNVLNNDFVGFVVRIAVHGYLYWILEQVVGFSLAVDWGLCLNDPVVCAVPVISILSFLPIGKAPEMGNAACVRGYFPVNGVIGRVFDGVDVLFRVGFGSINFKLCALKPNGIIVCIHF